MSEAFTFHPPRRRGLAFHTGAICFLMSAAGLVLARALEIRAGSLFLIFLLGLVLIAALVLFLAYRAYALLRAAYILEREGVHLQWGLRAEDIPMPDVMWVNPAGDLQEPLPRPWLRWPGAITGTRRAGDLGLVEFMAADARRLILVATPGRLYAISPEDPSAFLRAFQHLNELGSLSPIGPRSLYPSSLLRHVWKDRSARALLLVGLSFTLGVLVWVALTIPAQARIPLGFTPGGDPQQAEPAVRLALLPLANTVFFVADLLLGLFFYRRPESQALAYLLWLAGALTSLLFLGAMFLIVRAS